jgi:hypothetical protein
MKNENSVPFDYELAKQKLKEQFRSGQPLFGKEGAFAPLLQEMLNSILEGEMEGHLDEEERGAGNRKNGKSKKQLKTSSGTIEVKTPRDRLSSFEPEMVKKRRNHPGPEPGGQDHWPIWPGNQPSRYKRPYQGNL